jgi:hypothetical protein
MPHEPAKHGERWTTADVRQLEHLAARDVPTPDIARTLQRTEAAVTSKASEETISLGSPNRSQTGKSRR